MRGRGPLRRGRAGAACAAAALLAACTVTNVSLGSRLPADPGSAIVQGRTTKAQILTTFGPPTSLARYPQGEVFRYDYIEKRSRTLRIADPIVTNLGLFTYTSVGERSQRLLVLFDARGVVIGFGYRGEDEAAPAPRGDAVASPAR